MTNNNNTPHTVGHIGWSPDYKSTPMPPVTGKLISCRSEVDTAPEQWRSQCLVARIQRDEAYAKIRDCATRLGACTDGYAETRQAIADLAAILPENNPCSPS